MVRFLSKTILSAFTTTFIALFSVCMEPFSYKQSMEFSITRLFMNIIRTGSPVIVNECQHYFNFYSINQQIAIRTAKFYNALVPRK